MVLGFRNSEDSLSEKMRLYHLPGLHHIKAGCLSIRVDGPSGLIKNDLSPTEPDCKFTVILLSNHNTCVQGKALGQRIGGFMGSI